MKIALVTGITGQDGAYLAALLLGKGYEVHGVTRELGLEPAKYFRIKNILSDIQIHACNLNSQTEVFHLIKLVRPDEVYHLASDMNLNAGIDIEKELQIFDNNFHTGYNLLKAVKEVKSDCRFYAAGSSLMFGNIDESPQNELTKMNPSTPYGVAKVTLYHFIKMYRELHGLYACMGMLYNHESPSRDLKFLPRKITNTVANIKAGRVNKLILGNIDLRRDWSYAGDVVISMWSMLQQSEPKDFVIGSGELHSIRDLLEIAFNYVCLDWYDYVTVDPALFRKVDYDNLCADISSARKCLEWSPNVTFRQLIENMVEHDLALLKTND